MPLPSCPVCGDYPSVTRCEPWPRHLGAPWYVGCYKRGATEADEHCVAVNGDTRAEAERMWMAEVEKHKVG